MRFIPLLALLFLSPFSSHAAKVTHLVFAGGSVHAACNWETGPRVSEESVLRIEWRSGATHQAIEAPGAFKAALFMPSMGHGSAPVKIDRVLDERGNPVLGVYRVTRMYFTMPGDWVVNVSLKGTDGAEETQAIRVSL